MALNLGGVRHCNDIGPREAKIFLPEPANVDCRRRAEDTVDIWFVFAVGNAETARTNIMEILTSLIVLKCHSCKLVSWAKPHINLGIRLCHRNAGTDAPWPEL
jgi:hypothetical protein